MNQIFLGLTIALTINLLMFFPAYYWKTDKLTDISYSFTFIVLSTIMIIYHNTWIAGLMIIIRALRLWMYLLIRIMKIKRDNRFDKMRNDRKKFIQFWLLQGITVAIISIPLLLSSNNHISIIGIIIWGGWLLIEAIADYQKFQHIIYKRPKWIQNWLWKYSRHPNYFWEIIDMLLRCLFQFVRRCYLSQICDKSVCYRHGITNRCCRELFLILS